MAQSFLPLNRRLASLSILLAFCCLGCDSGPTMAPVRGVVNLLGKPLPGGRIIFEPISKSEGSKSAIGDIADDGTFELFTFEEGDGAIVGTYYPVVMDPKEDDENSQKDRKKIGIVDLTKTHLDVTAEGPNDFTIEITKADVKYGIQDD